MNILTEEMSMIQVKRRAKCPIFTIYSKLMAKVVGLFSEETWKIHQTHTENVVFEIDPNPFDKLVSISLDEFTSIVHQSNSWLSTKSVSARGINLTIKDGDVIENTGSFHEE